MLNESSQHSGLVTLKRYKENMYLHFIYHLHANGQIRISFCLLMCSASTVIIVGVEDDAFCYVVMVHKARTTNVGSRQSRFVVM
jgi:hypothetical protein